MKNLIKLGFSLATLALFLACGKGGEPEKGAAALPEEPAGLDMYKYAQLSGDSFGNFLEPLPVAGEAFELPAISSQFKGGVRTAFPPKYLADPLALKDLPLASPFPGKKIALVASGKAKLYADPFAKGATGKGALEKLKILKDIPIGTILPMLKTYEDAASDENQQTGLYHFEEEWNYFYLTEYKGQRGVVYGADLMGYARGEQRLADEVLMRLSYYYTKPAAAPAFARTIGAGELPKAAEAGLLADYLVFAEAPAYSLSAEAPDDLVALYQGAFADRGKTVFLTTDLVAHSLHLLFDRMLADTEEARFIPLLKYLVQGYLSEIAALKGADDQKVPSYTEALDLAETYFTVGKGLLAMAPAPAKILRSGEPVDSPAVDPAAIAALLSPEAAAEFKLVMDAKGFEESPNFDYKEDYSQFIPRGHYTKNERLKAYFRTMMFFGRIHFYLDFSTEEAAKLSEKLGPVALILNKVRLASPGLYATWRSLFDPITYLVGESDDLNFDDLISAAPDLGGLDIARSMGEGKLIDYMKALSKKLRGPRIQGNVTYENPSGAKVEGSGDRFGEPPKGWRFFGQRFVLDSSWTDRLTGGDIVSKLDPMNSRTMAAGLDVAASLGMGKAFELLRPTRDEFPLYDEILGKIKGEVAAMKAADWTKTFYAGYLDAVGRILRFEAGAGFYFTQKPFWSIKALQTGLSAWAELRHDTILYVKQSYAERAGGEDLEATYRTVKFPRPTHYVEPNLDFFYGLAGLLERSIPLLKDYKFLTPYYSQKFNAFANLVGLLAGIVEAEAVDAPIAEAQNEFIVEVPFLLAGIILPGDGGGSPYDEGRDQYRMAMVADVHTVADPPGTVLEVATGKPFMIYVALNDGQGGKRIAVGFTYSYYEFAHPMEDRLTDEKWKAFIYGKASKAELESKRPAWLRGLMP